MEVAAMNGKPVMIAVVLVGLAGVAAACGGGGTSTPTSTAATSAPSVSPVPASTPAAAAAVGPFTTKDLPDLVLTPSQGKGLVKGLKYRPDYSGACDLFNVRHWTLVPPERLEAVDFVAGYATLFFTDEFLSAFGRGGRSLLTVALVFDTPRDAARALRVLATTRDELWRQWRPLTRVSGAQGIAQTGRLGSDNVADTYPTTSFALQIGNVCVLVGSQGGSQSGKPLPEHLLRSVAAGVAARTQARLVQIQDGASQ
jgi:hypothetical protein